MRLHAMIAPEGRKAALLTAAAFLLLAGLAWLNFGKPLTSDEHWFVMAAHDYAAAGGRLAPGALIHPPLYILALGELLRAGWPPLSLKVPGLLLAFLSVWAMLMLARAAGATRWRAAAAAALLCASPLFVQGSLLLDTDNTLVTFSVLAAFGALYAGRYILLGAALLLCLWSKMAAAMPVMAVLAVYGALRLRRGGGDGRGILFSLAAASAVFLVTLYAFCRVHGLPFALPFEYMLGALTGKRTPGFSQLFQQILQFLLWAGLPFCLLWVRQAISELRGAGPGAALAGASLLMGCGYFFVGGTPFGFPKMQLPAVALGCWLASGPIVEALKDMRRSWALAAAAGAALLFLLGDPVYTFRYSLRGALAAGDPVYGYALLAAAQAAAPLLLALAAAAFMRRSARPALGALAIACAAQFAAQDALQARPHNTNYTYGASGLEGAVEKAGAALVNGGKAALPLEVTGYLRLRGLRVPKTPNQFWSDPEALKAAVSSPEYRALVFGAPFNTLEQIRILKGGDMAARLDAAGWRREFSGDYEIWTKNP